MDCYTPTSMINHLLPMIPTDQTIASYVNDHFGTKITADRIAKLRKGREPTPPTDHGPPLASDNRKVDARATLGSQQLLQAIRKAYPNGVPA